MIIPSLRSLHRWAKNKEMAFRGKYKSDDFALVKEDDSRKYYYYEDDVFYLALSETSHPFSCGVFCFGEFHSSGDLQSKSVEEWKNLIAYYMRKRKLSFYNCTTTKQKKYRAINQALDELGFKITHTAKSNHGRYLILVWEHDAL